MALPINSYWNDFLHLIFPTVCVACKNELLKTEPHICTHCRSNFSVTDHFQVHRNELWQSFRNKNSMNFAIAYLKFYKTGTIQPILHELKYRKNHELGIHLGNMFGGELQRNGYQKTFDILVPVPLHADKQKMRGYNQSELIATGVAEKIDVSVNTKAAKRTKHNKSQTKVAGTERWGNVDGIFELEEADSLKGKHVAIIDDVVTTGATIDALAETLKQAQPATISLLAFAIAQQL